MAKILFVGDSIRIGYFPFVKTFLGEDYECFQITGNGEDSKNVQKKLKSWLKPFRKEPVNIIHFNCGLHDIKKKFGASKHQVPLPQYEQNLQNIVAFLRKNTEAKLIWATTTPVLYNRHHATKGFDRFQFDVEAYNKSAAKIMEEAGILIDNLHEVVFLEREKLLLEDGVHYTEEGYQRLGKAVANFIRNNSE